MSKMSSDPVRPALNGPTMGTRWSALSHVPPGLDPAPLRMALQQGVDMADGRMSAWKPDSDLMRLNRAPAGQWVKVPPDFARVLTLGLQIARASAGAFDIGMGDAVRAWGLGPDAADPEAMRAALVRSRRPAHEVLEINGDAVRKTTPTALDLNDRQGIWRGLPGQGAGAPRDCRWAGGHRRRDARPGPAVGSAWTIAVEAPDPDRRTPHSVPMLQDGAVATSGDYRHGVTVQGRLSHTVDPRKSAPLAAPPASVTVVAPTCAPADAWATALVAAGFSAGAALAADHDLDPLFLLRDGKEGLQTRAVGRLFGSDATAAAGGRA
ncbi:FAD:protein FMN transferase [Paracoccus sp. WLY502]|nr:FAD:protein FMN transferase [Paracoccus sp. WLY502]MDQ1899576.1 FAD:protein FMN transferase [Paracoccus sp. WLY502]